MRTNLAVRETTTPPTTIPDNWLTLVYCSGDAGTTLEDATRQLVLTNPEDRYERVTRDVPTLKTVVSHPASIFLNTWKFLHGFSEYVLTESGT